MLCVQLFCSVHLNIWLLPSLRCLLLSTTKPAPHLDGWEFFITSGRGGGDCVVSLRHIGPWVNPQGGALGPLQPGSLKFIHRVRWPWDSVASMSLKGPLPGLLSQEVTLQDGFWAASAFCYRTVYHKTVQNHCFKGRKLRPHLSKCFFSFMKPISSSNFLYASETVLL